MVYWRESRNKTIRNVVGRLINATVIYSGGPEQRTSPHSRTGHRGEATRRRVTARCGARVRWMCHSARIAAEVDVRVHPACPCGVFVLVRAMSLSHSMSCLCPWTCPCRVPEQVCVPVLPPLFSPRVFVRCLRNCPRNCPRTCPCLYTRPKVVHLVSFPVSISCPCRIPDPVYVLSISMYCPVHVLAQFTAHLQLVSIRFHVVRELAAERSAHTAIRLLGFGGIEPAYLCVHGHEV